MTSNKILLIYQESMVSENATIPQHTWCTSARSRARSRAHRRPARHAGWSSCCGWVPCTPCTWSTPRATVSPCTQTSSYLQHGSDHVNMDCAILISWPKPVIKQWSWKYWLRNCHILAYSYNIAAFQWKLIRQLNFYDRNIIIIKNCILLGACFASIFCCHCILFYNKTTCLWNDRFNTILSIVLLYIFSIFLWQFPPMTNLSALTGHY